jgi:hypothetical protein
VSRSRTWHHGIGGQAYFITGDDRADLPGFLTEQFEAYGAEVATTDLTREEAASLIDVPFPSFLSQDCTLVIDKAKAQLGYVPVRYRDEALAELRRIHGVEEARAQSGAQARVCLQCGLPRSKPKHSLTQHVLTTKDAAWTGTAIAGPLSWRRGCRRD